MDKVIITGVSEGLGYQIAKQLLERQIQVVGISRTKSDLSIDHIPADLTQEVELDKAVSQITRLHPEFDCLVNCAGVLNVQPLENLNYQDMEQLFKLNVLAPIKLTSGLLELIKTNQADIVNVGSTIGFKAYEQQAAYGASKWAVRGFNTNLQLELKGSKCRVIGFNPGGFKSRIFEKATGQPTEDWTGWMDPADLAAFLLQILKLPKNMEVSEVVINRK